jgi:hypothetical protein
LAEGPGHENRSRTWQSRRHRQLLVHARYQNPSPPGAESRSEKARVAISAAPAALPPRKARLRAASTTRRHPGRWGCRQRRGLGSIHRSERREALHNSADVVSSRHPSRQGVQPSERVEAACRHHRRSHHAIAAAVAIGGSQIVAWFHGRKDLSRERSNGGLLALDSERLHEPTTTSGCLITIHHG